MVRNHRSMATRENIITDHDEQKDVIKVCNNNEKAEDIPPTQEVLSQTSENLEIDHEQAEPEKAVTKEKLQIDTQLENNEDHSNMPLEYTPAEMQKDNPSLSIKSFTQAGLGAKILKSIGKVGWKNPTPVQALCLPHALAKKDVAGFAQTGTGKTGAFLLTIGHLLFEQNKAEPGGKEKTFAVVLTPTRELAIQIEEECRLLLGELGISSAAIFGGMSWENQAKKLRQGIDVVIATPGRLKDFEQKNLISLNQVELFVCDEADRMFDMGFIEDVEYFLKKIKNDAQKMVFSATTNQRVKDLIFRYLKNPEYISVNSDEITPENIKQNALICETPQKFKLLLWLLNQHCPERAMIFTNTKMTALWLHYKLINNGVNADIITGDLPQAKRIKLIKNIKQGTTKYLIATDVASRGLHIDNVSHVYNFDLPDEAANYVHRIGRTARAGAKGASYSILCDEYSSNFSAIQKILGKNCPASQWPDPAFLEIEDKAGNPLDDEIGRAHV